jgi:hypothetical protein
VAPRKARKAANVTKRRDLRRVDQLGSKINTKATFDPIACLSVYSGQTCVGFLLRRGKSGVEAFGADDRSLGLFPNQQTEADAISAEVAS